MDGRDEGCMDDVLEGAKDSLGELDGRDEGCNVGNFVGISVSIKKDVGISVILEGFVELDGRDDGVLGVLEGATDSLGELDGRDE